MERNNTLNFPLGIKGPKEFEQCTVLVVGVIFFFFSFLKEVGMYQLMSLTYLDTPEGKEIETKDKEINLNWLSLAFTSWLKNYSA